MLENGKTKKMQFIRKYVNICHGISESCYKHHKTNFDLRIHSIEQLKTTHNIIDILALHNEVLYERISNPLIMLSSF